MRRQPSQGLAGITVHWRAPIVEMNFNDLPPVAVTGGPNECEGESAPDSDCPSIPGLFHKPGYIENRLGCHIGQLER
jgi:hypothetical protein